jgi:hypothetical protein
MKIEFVEQSKYSTKVLRDGKCIAFLENFSKRPARIVININDAILCNIFTLSEMREMVDRLDDMLEGVEHED